jgi:hypothetical protein
VFLPECLSSLFLLQFVLILFVPSAAQLLDEVLTVREYVSITNNSVGEVLATEVLKRGEEMMAEHRGFIASNKKIVTEW